MRLLYEIRGGYAPTKDHPSDAGWDLCSCEHRSMVPGEIHTFDLRIGLAFDLPGVYGRLAPKSGLAAKYGVQVLAGVIDEGYTGNIQVVIARLGMIRDGVVVDDRWEIRPGDRICQIIPEVIARVELADKVADLRCWGGNGGRRGDKGFGSGG